MGRKTFWIRIQKKNLPSINKVYKTRGCKESILVQTYKCSILIIGLHIFEIKLC